VTAFDLSDRARLILCEEHVRTERRTKELGLLSSQLRELLDQVHADLVASSSRLRQLDEMLGRAPQLPLDALGSELAGRRLREVAVEVLRQHRRIGEPIHYRQWLALVKGTGIRIGGKDPKATFLTQIGKAEDVESVSPRSGLYQLRAA
jgi:hypothetical protein